MAVTTNNLNGMTDASYDNVKDTFPKSIASTSGTISSVNGLDKKIVGASTVFLTDFQVGDYIWFTTTDEVRRIENIVDDTNLTLEFPVATTVTAVAFSVVRKTGYKNISWMNDSVGVADINNMTYPASTSRTMSSGANGSGGGKRIAPLLIDTTASSNIVYVSAE
tara:strand:+ start:8206 stop:8700 length:495 start_codon:yes stop_codon:yes gene_type:complete